MKRAEHPALFSFIFKRHFSPRFTWHQCTPTAGHFLLQKTNNMATILELANTDRNLSSFMKGIKAAGMEDILSGMGPFTLLAPVNLAFGKLAPPETFDNLLKNEPVRLAEILGFHVIKAKRLLKDFRDGQKLQTISGQDLAVTIKEGVIHINGARILAKDRQGSNGVVHSIDCINLPAVVKPVL